jgi:hypothetical protein
VTATRPLNVHFIRTTAASHRHTAISIETGPSNLAPCNDALYPKRFLTKKE